LAAANQRNNVLNPPQVVGLLFIVRAEKARKKSGKPAGGQSDLKSDHGTNARFRFIFAAPALIHELKRCSVKYRSDFTGRENLKRRNTDSLTFIIFYVSLA
jgi:hypothetical protein